MGLYEGQDDEGPFISDPFNGLVLAGAGEAYIAVPVIYASSVVAGNCGNLVSIPSTGTNTLFDVFAGPGTSVLRPDDASGQSFSLKNTTTVYLPTLDPNEPSVVTVDWKIHVQTNAPIPGAVGAITKRAQ
jgi:hypothetical protein